MVPFSQSISTRSVTPAGELARVTTPLSREDQERVLKRLEWISRMFDEAVRVPGTSIRLGWDAVLGLVPFAGDAVTSAVSAYYLWEANRLGARKRVLGKMLGNIAIDFAVGSIPLVGDLADVAFRANRKNMRVLLQELQSQGKLAPDVSEERLSRLLGAAKKSHGKRPTSLARLYPLIMP